MAAKTRKRIGLIIKNNQITVFTLLKPFASILTVTDGGSNDINDIERS